MFVFVPKLSIKLCTHDPANINYCYPSHWSVAIVLSIVAWNDDEDLLNDNGDTDEGELHSVDKDEFTMKTAYSFNKHTTEWEHNI